jgi:hypothetical protein
MGKKAQPLEKDRSLQDEFRSNLPLQNKTNSKILKSLNLKFYKMKKNVMFLLAALVSLSLFAKTPAASKTPNPAFRVFARNMKGEKVSPVVEAKFKKQYGKVVNVSWSIVDDMSDVRITIATFTEDGEQKEVYYYDDGEVYGTGKTIRRDALPENITKSIKERYSSAVIQTAYEFNERSSSTRYYVRVVTPRHSMIVSATEFGDIRVYQKERLKHIFQ